ncbi:BPL-N domain-containing protein [soil metagenome]
MSQRLTVLLLTGLALTMTSESRAIQPTKIRVGLLNDAECTDEKSREAVWKVISAAVDLEPRRVTGAELRAGALADLDVLIAPGGTGSGEAKALGVEGGNKVVEFVKSGKGFIGICAGGYLMVEGWTPETKAIELLNAETFDDEHWARGEGMVTVKVEDSETTHTMWFENGPIFAPLKMEGVPAYTPLVKYVTDMAAKDAPTGMMAGRDAVAASTLGEGRVVGFGPHPELSPEVNYWLPNAIRWAARRKGVGMEITPAAVLEGGKKAP